MKTRPAAFCLSILFVLLTACGHSSHGVFVPSSESASQPPAAGSQAPAVESQSLPAAEPQPSTISPSEYHAMVSALNGKIMDESELLIRAGLYEYNWWSSHSDGPEEVDLDTVLELAMEWLSETFHSDADTAAAVCAGLTADYAAIVRANVDGPVSAEVSGRIDALFAAYRQLYAIVTRPSGSVQDFVRMLCSCTYSITTLSAELTSALETAQRASISSPSVGHGARLLPEFTSG